MKYSIALLFALLAFTASSLELSVTQQERDEFFSGGGVKLQREYGEGVGLYVRKSNEGTLFYKSGLRVDNLITSVNNIDATKTENAMSIYRELNSAKALNIVIVREPVKMPLVLNISFQKK